MEISRDAGFNVVKLGCNPQAAELSLWCSRRKRMILLWTSTERPDGLEIRGGKLHRPGARGQERRINHALTVTGFVTGGTNRYCGSGECELS